MGGLHQDHKGASEEVCAMTLNSVVGPARMKPSNLEDSSSNGGAIGTRGSRWGKGMHHSSSSNNGSSARKDRDVQWSRKQRRTRVQEQQFFSRHQRVKAARSMRSCMG